MVAAILWFDEKTTSYFPMMDHLEVSFATRKKIGFDFAKFFVLLSVAW